MVNHKPKGMIKNDIGKLPYKRFEKEVDREKLEVFLAEDPEMESFLNALHDPAYKGSSFVTICRQFAVPLAKLQSIYTDGMRHLGLIRMSTALPEIMEHVAEDAKSRDIPCPRCDGKLVLKSADGVDKPCHVCHERGTVRIPGDKHARDLVFESMKLTAQNSPLVSITQNIKQDESMADMFKMTQAITVGQKEEAPE